MSIRDFKAKQLRTTSIIGSGSNVGTEPSVLIYSASAATDSVGSRHADLLTNIGTDVFLFVSGSKTTDSNGNIAHSNNSANRVDTAVFGGDLVVSGVLYAEVLRAEVDMATTGSLTVEGPLFVTGSSQFGNGPAERANLDAKVTIRTELNDIPDKSLYIDHNDTNDNAVYVDASNTDSTAVYIEAHALTTGTGLLVETDSDDLNGAVLVDVDNNSGDPTDAQTALRVQTGNTNNASDSNANIGLDIDFNPAAGTAARALRIDSEQTTGVVAEVNADALTTGTAVDVSTDARTTGTALSVSDSATNDNAGSLVKIAQTGNRAGSAASTGLEIDFNTVANSNARALKIDSEQTTGIVAEINGDEITTGTAVDVSADKLTTGKGLSLTSTSNSLNGAVLLDVNASGTSTDDYTVVKITKDASNGDNSNEIIGLHIDFDMEAGTAGRALSIDSEQTTGEVVSIDAGKITTGAALSVSLLDSGLNTTGGAVKIRSDSTSTSAHSLLKVHKDETNGSDSNAIVGLDIDFDMTDGTAGRALRILSDQTDGIVTEINADALTSGTALDISMDNNSLDGGTGILVRSDSTSTNDYTLLKLHKDEANGSDTSANAIVGLDIDFDMTAGTAGRAMRIVSDQTTGVVSEMKGDSVDTGAVLVLSGAGVAYAGEVFKVVGRGERTLVEYSQTAANASIPQARFLSSSAVPNLDVSFFVSGSSGDRGDNKGGVSLFAGDVVISGSLTDGDGNPIAGGGTSGSFNEVAVSSETASFVTTASLSIAGGLGFEHDVHEVGTDVYFFVSGTIGEGTSGATGGKKSVFGGDMIVSGGISLLGDLNVGEEAVLPVTASLIDIGFDPSAADNTNLNPTLRLTSHEDTIDSTTKLGIIEFFGNDLDANYAGVGAKIQAVPSNEWATPNGGDYHGGSPTRLELWSTSGGGGSGFSGYDYDRDHIRGIVVDGDRVLILSGARSSGNSDPESEYPDMNFFVSGSAGTRNKSVRGTAVFGGDLVVSGVLYGDKGAAIKTLNKEGALIVNTATDQVLVLSGSSSDDPFDEATGADVAFYVSGAVGSRGTSERGTSLFGGDVAISGSLFVGQLDVDSQEEPVLAVDYENKRVGIGTSSPTYALDVVRSDGTLYDASTDYTGGDGQIRVRNTYGTVKSSTGIIFSNSSDGATSGLLSTVDPEQSSGADVVKVILDAHRNDGVVIRGKRGTRSHNQVLILSGGAETSPNEADYTDLAFFVSGAIGSAGTAERGTSVFGGDVVISGTLSGGSPLVIDGDIQVSGTIDISETTALKATALSGSLTHLQDGTSYLIAGTNVTITTGSNGAVTIASTATGGGSAVSNVGWLSPANQVISTTGSLKIGTADENNPDINLGSDGSAVFNEQGASVDFRVESDNLSHMVFVDGSANQIAIGAPSADITSDAKLVISSSTDTSLLTLNVNTPNVARTNSIMSVISGSAYVFNLDKHGKAVFNPDFANQTNPTVPLDVTFFVSGSTNLSDRHSAAGGVAVFGGNIITSGSIVPGVDSAVDLGTENNRFRNVYTGDLHLRNERGDWTIVEEKDYLCVINNITGRKYRMNLTPIED